MEKIQELKDALKKNEILNYYKSNSQVCINNFLLGGIDKNDFIYYDFNENLDETDLFYEKDYLEYSGFIEGTAPYNPVTSDMIEGVMLLDALFRVSAKQKRSKPITVYRGLSSVGDKALNFNCIISTSLDKLVAYRFAKTKLMKFRLNENFPLLSMNEFTGKFIKTSFYNCELDEKEILLPPCTGKIVGQKKLNVESKAEDGAQDYIDYLEVELVPQSLAEVFLARMNNLPADFPKRFVNDKDYEFAKSKRRLESYVKNFVKTGKIPSASDVVKKPSSSTFGE